MGTASAPGAAVDPVAPEAEPGAIRDCLSDRLTTEFDAEWIFALDEAKVSRSLVGVHDLLNKWRHIAYGELRDPGSYYRMLAKAEQILRTGENPTGRPIEEVRALIRARLGQ